MTKRNPYQCRKCGLNDMSLVSNSLCDECKRPKCRKCQTTWNVVAGLCAYCYEINHKCKFCGKGGESDCGECCTRCGERAYVLKRKCANCYKAQFPKQRYYLNRYNCTMRAKYLARTIWTVCLIGLFVFCHTMWRLANVPNATGPNMELVKYAIIAGLLTIAYGSYIISTYPKGEWR